MDKENQELIEILTRHFEDITNRPITFPFEVTDDSMIPAGKKVNSIVIKPILVGVVMKLQPLVLQLSQNGDLSKMLVDEKRDFTEETPELFQKYQNLILDIITIGIHNKESDPPEWFKKMLIYNCTWKDLHIFLNAILFRMGFKNFWKSISLIYNGLSLTKEAELIALQKRWKTIKFILKKREKLLTLTS